MSGKVSFLKDAKGTDGIEQPLAGPHPSQVGEILPERHVVTSVLDEMGLCVEQYSNPGVRKEIAKKRAAVSWELGDLAVEYADAKKPGEMPGTQDVIATLSKLKELSSCPENEDLVRDIVEDKLDELTRCELVRWTYLNDKENKRSELRTDPRQLSLEELRAVAQQALINCPTSKGGRPQSSKDPMSNFVPIIISRLLQIDPELKSYFVDDPDLCFRMLDSVFCTMDGENNKLYRDRLAAAFDWWPQLPSLPLAEGFPAPK